MHVLVPMDGSPLSERALEHALETYPDAAVTVLHVVDPIDAVYAAEEGGPTFSEAWAEAAEKRAERIAADARETAAEHGVDLTTATEFGRPARTIVAYVEDHDVDHVVMGSHGRSGVDRLLMGSVSERVVRRSPVSVTVVR